MWVEVGAGDGVTTLVRTTLLRVERKDLSDPDYRVALTDLLGLLAYGELQGHHRITADSVMAPTLAEQARTAQMAVTEFRQYEKLYARLVELQMNPETAMAPFVSVINSFHAQTAPSNWLESLVKLYVGDGIARDFYLEISGFVDPETSGLVRSVFADRGQADFVVSTVRTAITTDPVVGGRLALWARRLVVEALSQAQRVSVDRDSLARLLIEGEDGLDLVGVGELFNRLTARHTDRMALLGLEA